MRDFYEVLGIQRNADEKAIRDAFRRLALKYHPDRNKEPGAEAKFKEIAEAYAVLSDPKKRAEYDARGQEAVSGYSPEDLFGGINFEDLLGGFGIGGFEFGGYGESPFDRFFGHRRIRPSRPRRGSNIEITLTVSLDRVLRGGTESIRFRRPDGQEKQYSVNIPAGIDDGSVLRLPGEGMPAPGAGGVPGDLFAFIHTRPDPRFERRGKDLWLDQTVTLEDAVLGGKVRVQTLEGTSMVTVPEGTQPETTLRLRGKGLPEFGSTRRGDLFVRVHVTIPSRLSREQRELFEKLRALPGRRAA